MFKLKTTLDRHSPRLIIDDSLLADPPLFSLPTTFKYGRYRTVLRPMVIFYVRICNIELIGMNMYGTCFLETNTVFFYVGVPVP
jgi:hypothetical protein